MEDNYIGAINLYPYTFAPIGTLLCNGQLLNISQNETLFSLIGTTYGGNGTTNFAIPNMLGLEPVPGTNYYIAIEGEFPPRNN